MVNNTPQVKYIIDTSSILSQKDNEPHRRTINKTLWKHIDELISQKRIVTCSEIIEEVNDDALKKWFVGLQGDILPIDDEVQENVKKVVTSNPQLVDFKQVKSSGDAFLIATAMKYDLTVITEENKTGQKKIPFVCNSLGVPCVDILGLCEKEGWSFLKGVREGTFTVPGDGDVDFAPIFDIIEKSGYEGYVVVEAEQDPAKANPLEYAMKARKYIAEKTGL